MRKFTLAFVFAFLLLSVYNPLSSKLNPEYPSVKSALSPGHTFVLKKKKRTPRKEEELNPNLKEVKDLEWYYFTFEKDFGFMNNSRAAIEIIKVNLAQELAITETVEITGERITPVNDELQQQHSTGSKRMNIPNTIWKIEEIGGGSVY
ncbi:MAG: hypothetical protein K1X92_00050 [Bacteroidia bacterium]|nr:hypothetical protein [Bacteroidia bacterium]